jgi:hypothetical protein
MEERMTNEEFAALMKLCHYNIINKGLPEIVNKWADKEARLRGYQSWIEAYQLTNICQNILPKVINAP